MGSTSDDLGAITAVDSFPRILFSIRICDLTASYNLSCRWDSELDCKATTQVKSGVVPPLGLSELCTALLVDVVVP
jgi:hypothetical protein